MRLPVISPKVRQVSRRMGFLVGGLFVVSTLLYFALWILVGSQSVAFKSAAFFFLMVLTISAFIFTVEHAGRIS